jgi:hypothetical protein
MNDVTLLPLTFLKYKVIKEIYLLRSNYMYNIYFDNHAIKSFLKTSLKYNTICNGHIFDYIIVGL